MDFSRQDECPVLIDDSRIKLYGAEPSEEHLGTLFPEERAFIQNAVPKRQYEFATGRFCARQAMLARGFEQAPILVGEKRVPLWPEGVVGSISHTDHFCVAAVAAAAELSSLGIDVERATPLRSDLVSRICRREEVESLADYEEDERLRVAKILFSAKEAFYKWQYTFTQTFLGFHALRIELNDNKRDFRAVLCENVGPLAAGDAREGRVVLWRDLVFTSVVG